ncbi:MAG: hypothetical protein A2096_10850 [Spirochaetes bacterium GWF1_41_5]|nr:MAG: hypothetical protein A2096_10850 [Spirochaetes bacterium GWF1_41_5]HBE03398.1 hypothetical protein [Spirochaetia bacterium]
MEAVKKKCSESLDQICTGCSYCDHCPMGIPVPKLMDAANYLKLYRNPEKVLDRLRFHWGFGRSAENIITRCNSCGKCENLCTQKLPIRRRLIELAPFMEQLIKK